MGRRRKKKLPSEIFSADIESLSHDGRGVAHLDGKTIFIDGALPGEEIGFLYTSQRRKFDEGRAVEIKKPSPDRVEPKCEHYGVCGGCSLQHMSPEAQIQSKQQVMLDNLARIGKVTPQSILPPLTDNPWGYRRRARLGVKHVFKKGKVLVGFREKRAPYVAELNSCHVLLPSVGEKLTDMANLIEGLSIHDKIPQIEVAVGDDKAALVFRHLEPLTDEDNDKLIAFGEQHNFMIYLQPQGPDSITLLYPEGQTLTYQLPDYEVDYVFEPSDFVQVNANLNRKMVNHALALLQPEAGDEILDLFCGLGNFTLPIARTADKVTGVEGDKLLVERANTNAKRNNIDNVEFHYADLTQDLDTMPWLKRKWDKILIDPPRTGALEVIEHLPKTSPKRIVYVSCNPATLARDADELVNKHGYKLVSVGVMDMFPHTAHVEAIALFER